MSTAGAATFLRRPAMMRGMKSLTGFDPIRSRSLSTLWIHTRATTALIGRSGDDSDIISGYTCSGYGCSRYRRFSSRSQKENKRFNLRALPFSISPEEALESFRKWAEDDQGLRYLMNYNSVRIGAAYVPVWSFDLNIRFKQQTKKSGSYSWKPSIFEGYDQTAKQDVIYLPGGLSAYAGYSYRRSLINSVHSTTLIFMGDQTQPFGSWMLRDMVLKETGLPIQVVPDAWNSTQARAFTIVKEELQEIVNGDWMEADIPSPIVQTEVVSARRVFMPTFVIEYKILGLEYQAFVSGCDTSAPVGGVSHQIFEGSDMSMGGLSPEFQRSSRNLLVQLSSGATRLLQTINLPILLSIFRPLFSLLWFVLVRIATLTPVIGVAGGAFAGFRKILQPWMDNRKASAEWERQRQNEMYEDEDEASGKSKMNDFNDVTGRARAHFQRNRESILRSLSGDASHEEGDFDWYSDWQSWAQQQWEQQARQQQQQQQNYYNQQQQQYQQYQQQYQWQQRQQQQQQQQQRQRPNSNPKKDEFKWPFNPNDPYSVLGIERNVSDSEVSNAFRKEMLKYHPDTQPNASEAQKRRSVERSKLITEAYRKIKTERKERRRR